MEFHGYSFYKDKSWEHPALALPSGQNRIKSTFGGSEQVGSSSYVLFIQMFDAKQNTNTSDIKLG